jgi:hypothetical protein
VVYLHSLAMTVVIGGLLRDHDGHKTWVAWVFTGVVLIWINLILLTGGRVGVHSPCSVACN